MAGCYPSPLQGPVDGTTLAVNKEPRGTQKQNFPQSGPLGWGFNVFLVHLFMKFFLPGGFPSLKLQEMEL